MRLAVSLNFSVCGFHTRIRLRPGAATNRARRFQTRSGGQLCVGGALAGDTEAAVTSCPVKSVARLGD